MKIKVLLLVVLMGFFGAPIQAAQATDMPTSQMMNALGKKMMKFSLKGIVLCSLTFGTTEKLWQLVNKKTSIDKKRQEELSLTEKSIKDLRAAVVITTVVGAYFLSINFVMGGYLWVMGHPVRWVKKN